MASQSASEVMHKAGNVLPVFTATEIRSNVTELFNDDCIAFAVHTDCDYRIDGVGVSSPLRSSDVRGFPIGAAKVTFSPAVTIEIM